jgi:hypothetical protein
MHENTAPPETHFLRRSMVYGAGLLLGAAIGADIAANHVPNHIQVGPIEAEVKIEPSNVIEGSFAGKTLQGSVYSPLGLVGAHLEVTNLTTDLGPLTDRSSTQHEAVNSAFAQLFTNTSHDMDLAVAKIERRLLEGSASGVAAALALELSLLAYSRRLKINHPNIYAHWQELYHHYQPARRRAVAAISAAAVISGGTLMGLNETQDVRPTPALAHIPGLEKVQLTGSLADKIIELVRYVNSVVNNNKTFYKGVVGSAVQQFTPEYAAQLPPEGTHIVPILAYSDRHCNVGMDPVLAENAKLYHVKLAISAGDDDFSGTLPFEFACTSELASYFKALGIAEVSVLGNHDSSSATDPAQDYNTAEWEASQGIHVLGGEPVVIKLPDGGSIVLLGDRDPRRSRLGHAIVTVGGGSEADALQTEAQDLAAAACKLPTPVDILVTHSPSVAVTAINDGCGNINFSYSGHLHEYFPPELMGYDSLGRPVYREIGGTSGGAKEDTPTFGPLQEPAPFDILYWNSETRQVIGTIHNVAMPNGTEILGSYIPLQTTAPTDRTSHIRHARR